MSERRAGGQGADLSQVQGIPRLTTWVIVWGMEPDRGEERPAAAAASADGASEGEREP
jgi:hypothetical protein